MLVAREGLRVMLVCRAKMDLLVIPVVRNTVVLVNQVLKVKRVQKVVLVLKVDVVNVARDQQHNKQPKVQMAITVIPVHVVGLGWLVIRAREV